MLSLILFLAVFVLTFLGIPHIRPRIGPETLYK